MALSGDDLGLAIVEALKEPIKESLGRSEDINEDAVWNDMKPELKDKWKAVGVAIVDYIKENAEVKNVKTKLDSGLNTIFSNGIPVASDGGAALKTIWQSITSGGTKDSSSQTNSGEIE